MPSKVEEWRDVIGYKGLYEVSSHGRVRSVRTRKAMAGCSIGRGYSGCHLSKNDEKQTCTFHALVARAFLGKRPSGKEVNHKDGNKDNNHVSNLEYVTHKENVRHAASSGLMCSGERIPWAKLTWDNVRYIRANEGIITGYKLAKMFGVTDGCIYQILKRKTWVKEPGPTHYSGN